MKKQAKPIQKYRFFVQLSFVIICLWIGLDFHFFVKALEEGNLSNFYRPAGVEAFLPISALMSLYYFLLTGIIHPAHPAGFFILMGVISVSFVFGKSFCSWICPVGFASELVGDFGDRLSLKLFKRKLYLPKFIDYPLRSLKYLLLLFFVFSIFFSMTVLALKYFLDSPYNIVADIKMYLFFAEISEFSLIVISTLFFLSIVIKNFWCRYLCPYGALLGLISFFSPTRIKRDMESCINCSLCSKACPSHIKVDKVKTVISDECTSCLSCVDACPVKDTLQIRDRFFNKVINKKHVAIGVVVIYFLFVLGGIISGKWNNKTSTQEYKEYYKIINSLGHPTNSSQIKDLNKKAKQLHN